MVKKIFAQTYIWVILLLMYLPILVLIAFSFTDAPYIGQWHGFTWDLYARLFQNSEIMIALGNTVIIAISSALVSTLLGTMGAIGAYNIGRKKRKAIDSITQIPIVNAEIVMALSLTILFVFVQTYIFKVNIFSFWTLLIGHCVLSIPFVYTSVKPKLEQMDPSLYEAALDLGCSPSKALRKVTIPEILPGILSGFLLAITLSLDDFIITAFTRGTGLLNGESMIVTISTYVQDIIRKRPVPPEMRALTTLIFALVVVFVVIITIRSSYKQKHGNVGRRGERTIR